MKIGMCCACGGSFPKSQTRIVGQFEYCATCLENADVDRACRVCGCTEEDGCAEGCWWVETDLCSACVEEKEE